MIHEYEHGNKIGYLLKWWNDDKDIVGNQTYTVSKYKRILQ